MTIEENKATARKFLDMIEAQDHAGYASVCSPEVARRWELEGPKAYARWGTPHIGVTGMVAEGDEV